MLVLICTSCKQTRAKEGESMVVESIGLLESGSTMPQRALYCHYFFIPSVPMLIVALLPPVVCNLPK